MLAAPAAAAPPQPDLDLACLVDVARAKDQLGEADRRRADLVMMYYLGRLTAQMSEVEVSERLEQLPRPTQDEQAATRRRCAAELITAALFMAPLNKALADAAK